MNRWTLCVHSQDSTRLPLLIKMTGRKASRGTLRPEGHNEILKLSGSAMKRNITIQGKTTILNH